MSPTPRDFVRLSHALSGIRRQFQRRATRRFRGRRFDTEPLEVRLLLSAVTPDNFTIAEVGPNQLRVIHDVDWDAQSNPESRATFESQRVVQSAGSNHTLTADDYVSVDPTKSYSLSGWLKSGDNFGMRFNAANQQSFGAEIFDADYLRIDPVHAVRHANATVPLSVGHAN